DHGSGAAAALALTLLFAFATLEWDYAHDAFDVGPATLFLLAAVFAARRAGRQPGARWPLLAGAAAGFETLLRIAGLLALPVLALYLVGAAWPDRRRTLELLGWFAL